MWASIAIATSVWFIPVDQNSGDSVLFDVSFSAFCIAYVLLRLAINERGFVGHGATWGPWLVTPHRVEITNKDGSAAVGI
ncbi:MULTISPECIES: hypothetical protein [Actinomadura]|uniref:Uncharacterized protein n=1 Tax=Actinomadura yumaensis TaxID=111807 RepID=A0ABW2CCL8_9ACTN|nr:hypothetical protein [Actinomadura sp. J1-007]MWK38317.1 hypothetical protein [Actinomadura sp. J1-007]